MDVGPGVVETTVAAASSHEWREILCVPNRVELSNLSKIGSQKVLFQELTSTQAFGKALNIHFRSQY